MMAGCTGWPAAAEQEYQRSGYWRDEHLSDLLRAWCRRYGTATALVCHARRLSYAQLDDHVDRLAAGFLQEGIQAGDRVVVQLPNVSEFIICIFALFRIDAKPVFALLAHRVNEISHLCTIAAATGYILPGRYGGFDYAAMAAELAETCPSLRKLFVLNAVPDGASRSPFKPLAEIAADPIQLPAPNPADVAFFLLSGGTTALPKLIPRTHRDYGYQLRQTAELIGLSQQDVYLAVLPVEFNFTLGCPGVLGTLSVGGRVVLTEDADAALCFDTIEAEAVTVTSLVPSLAHLWLDAAGDSGTQLASLRLVQIGGAPLHREIAEQVMPGFGCQLQQVFGMAEGLLSMTRLDDPIEAVLGTQGSPISTADEIRIIDAQGDLLPVGATGELLVRGPYTIRGYFDASEYNRRAFTADGYLRTGDLARITDTGRLVIEGRVKDVIIRAGHKISAAEVEGHLLHHPSVDRVVVIGLHDPYLGERICAVVKPVQGTMPSLAELRAALHEGGLADFKLPDQLEFTTELEFTGLGKVDKKRMAQMIENRLVARTTA